MGDLSDAGIQVVGITPDSVEKLDEFSSAEQIGFPLLSDTDSKTIKEFGIHNEQGLPHPGTIVVDKSGIVHAKIFREGFRDRHPATELIDAVSTLASQK